MPSDTFHDPAVLPPHAEPSCLTLRELMRLNQLAISNETQRLTKKLHAIGFFKGPVQRTSSSSLAAQRLTPRCDQLRWPHATLTPWQVFFHLLQKAYVVGENCFPHHHLRLGLDPASSVVYVNFWITATECICGISMSWNIGLYSSLPSKAYAG
jgi:hypothetical protein